MDDKAKIAIATLVAGGLAFVVWKAQVEADFPPEEEPPEEEPPEEEPPEEEPPINELLQFTRMEFTYVDETNYVQRVDFIPVGHQSNVGVYFRKLMGEANESVPMDVKVRAIYPNGTVKNWSNHLDNIDQIVGAHMAYTSFLYEGDYLFEVSGFISGELIAYREFTVIGRRP